MVNNLHNVKHMLPTMYHVHIDRTDPPHQLDVAGFDFMLQLLLFLQNRDIMIQENRLINLKDDPTQIYYHPNQQHAKVLSGRVYQDVYI
jgi:hypothetical protein